MGASPPSPAAAAEAAVVQWVTPAVRAPRLEFRTFASAAIQAQVFSNDEDYFLAQSPWRLAEQHADTLRATTRVRQVIGDRDETFAFNRDFDLHLTRLRIPHTFTVLPGIGHNPVAVLTALGDANWGFYRAAEGP